MEKEVRMLLYMKHFLHENEDKEEADLPPKRMISV